MKENLSIKFRTVILKRPNFDIGNWV